MAKRKVPKTWQQLERDVADMFGALFGTKLFRNPLSGANNRNDDGSKRRGDIILPPGVDWIVECKYRSGISFHRFFDQAVQDAELDGVSPEHVILFSKEKRKKMLATLDARMLFKILYELEQCGRLDVIFGSYKEGTESKDKDR